MIPAATAERRGQRDHTPAGHRQHGPARHVQLVLDARRLVDHQERHAGITAEEEAGMVVRRPEMFDRVVQALHTLGVERDTEHTPPTK